MAVHQSATDLGCGKARELARCSTAEATVDAISEILATVSPISLIAATDLTGRRLDAVYGGMLSASTTPKSRSAGVDKELLNVQMLHRTFVDQHDRPFRRTLNAMILGDSAMLPARAPIGSSPRPPSHPLQLSRSRA